MKRANTLKYFCTSLIVFLFIGTGAYSQELNQEYFIESAFGTFLDVKEANDKPRATVWTWYNNKSSGQTWEFENAEGEYFYIKSKLGHYLDIKEANPDTRAKVWMWSKNRSSGQLWKFEDAGDGYFYIKSKLGKYLDIKEGNPDTRAELWMWTKNEGSGQKWKLIPIEIPQIYNYEIVLYIKTGQDDLRYPGRIDVIAQWLNGGENYRQERFKNINNSKGLEAWSTKKISFYSSTRVDRRPDVIYIAADLDGADRILFKNLDSWDFQELRIEIFSLNPKKKQVFSNVYKGGKDGIATIDGRINTDEGIKFSDPILFRLNELSFGKVHQTRNWFDTNY
ncbi:RICIN domain-containing protein [Zobellia uliginosa]|uniref:RICIN domain-containing protein n=1 Tax=Zobellia uliginosa TaxID=143224 RepID=UPI001C07394F|nr:RICIN domain-containing protein [Zobellia uliginosa]MBU2947370.1 RICIN domain-containing protein [Zobellia uliginosa]